MEHWNNAQGVKTRMGKASSIFNRINNFLKNHNLMLDIKAKFLLWYIFSILLYGVESWHLRKPQPKKSHCYRDSDIQHNYENALIGFRKMKNDLELMNAIKLVN